MYNLLEHSKNYSITAGSFWSYYRDEPKEGAGNNINYSIKDSEPSDYKQVLQESLKVTKEEVEITVPLKHLGNFWRTLDMLLINCEINLILTWSESCVLTSKATRDADPDANPAVAVFDNPANAIFEMTDTKVNVPVVTLLTENDKTPLEN